MDFVNLIVGALSQLCHCVANHTSYIRELQENLDSLRNAMRALNDMKTDVKRRIESAEVQQLRPRQQVQSWIQSVEEMEGQVNELLEQGSQQISNRCLGGCCPKNSCSSYKIGKKVIEKLTTVEELRSTGNFNDVADLLPPANVEAMPSTPTVGMDLMFENVWRCLIEEDQVRIIGLYGMGGVGKTTLLTKINDEFLRQGASDSGMVIFVTVSKESNVMRVQKDIGERVGLSFPEDASQDARAARIFNALSKKKIILLLDDIWDRVDFKAVGIPSPDIKNKSKIIFTTRSEAVCGLMEAQKKIKVECLRPDEAWDLFQKMVGEEALNSHPDIPKLAKIVAKECAGLPLSISTIGRAMASRKTPQEWTHAITVLKKSASEFLGMEDKVFSVLKFSYDSLPNDIQSCFLYCSLYPEDYAISKEELIQHWIGEGFIVGYNDMNEALNHGHHIIETLKQACLLESHDSNEDLNVKMHDVIRDLALWIASECGRKKDNFLVKVGLHLTEAPEVEKWEEAKRISLMYNDIRALTEPPPMCRNLITLLLNENRTLERISNGFFKSMIGLRVLDLTLSSIEEFPLEIAELVVLQYLNLSYTKIKTLPDEMKNLLKLKYLNLKYTTELKKIPLKVISRLPRLQVLNLCQSRFGDSEVEGWGGASLGEFEHLKHLKSFGITIRTVSALQRLFTSQKLLMCTNDLVIFKCQGFISFPPPSSTCTDMKFLKDLCLSHCSDLEEMVAGEGEKGFSLSLEKLYLANLPKLKRVRAVAHHPCFQNLLSLHIESCDALKNLTWLLNVGKLQKLHIANCKGIEEIIWGDVSAEEEITTFSRLKTVMLISLPKLRSIYGYALPFPSLKMIEVNECPELKKLPLDSNSAKNTLRRIRGEAVVGQVRMGG